MNTQQIKRAKRLAEIMGIEIFSNNDGSLYIKFNQNIHKPFNPEQDKALLWDLMVKYKEEIDMDDNFIYTKDSGIPAALIDCVIEINGGYDE